MTKQTDRELDAQVGRMLGRNVYIRHVSPRGYYPRRLEDEPFEMFDGRESIEQVHGDGRLLTRYTKDIHAAIKAMETVADDRGAHAEIVYYPNSDPRERYCVAIDKEAKNMAGQPGWYVQRVGNSLARTICETLCALPDKEKHDQQENCRAETRAD